MVSCRTQGRLGNWMFQFSATYAHSRRMGVDYAMPTNSLNEYLWPTPRFGKVNYADRVNGRLYLEPKGGYQPIPEEKNLILEGYWQSRKFFEGYEAEIAELIDFPTDKKPYVAVHVRRGDYLQYPDQFPTLEASYYKEAIGIAKEKGYKEFKIFTDDIKWCAQNIPGYTFSTGGPISDMDDIYSSAGAIISNSSFSLFPSLLRTDGAMVIAPKEDRWYGDLNKHLPVQDLMDDKWIKI